MVGLVVGLEEFFFGEVDGVFFVFFFWVRDSLHLVDERERGGGKNVNIRGVMRGIGGVLC